ncbi:MAG TPA: DNA alkylation repair protein [Actinomycetaceae bacterium]|nr:DNA alkylation repair protein [Actinomycetaceae bacterium]
MIADALARDIRRGLAEAANTERALAMQRYMKSAMPFRGVPSAAGRANSLAAVRRHPLADRSEWEAVIRSLFDDAEYREERYGALHVLHARQYRGYLDRAAVPLLEHMIITGAWWDLVDDASTAAGDALLRDRSGVVPALERWATGPDMWLARAAIIAQRKLKTETDFELMVRLIEPSIGSREFFLQKGIGWALREHSKTDPDGVRAYVASHPGLAPLSRREALKWLARHT